MRKFLLTIFLIQAMCCLKGMADTITLKDGTKIEGKITQQTDTEVTISYQVSAGISDEKTVKRTDIAEIVKTSAEDISFAQLQSVKPDPMATLPAETYRNDIAALKSFLELYPDSAHKAEVQAVIDTLQDEQKRVASGEIKLYGLWVSKKEAAARALQIQGQQLFLEMKAGASRGDVIGVLNAFDQLEKNCATTRAYPLAIEFVKPIESSFIVRVARSQEDLKVENEKWAQDVEVTPEPAKSQTIAARKAELDRDDVLMKNGMKWPPFIPQSKNDLDALFLLLTSEKTRLAALPVDQMNDSVAITDKASESINAHDLDTAESLLKNAVKLWPQNEEAGYLQKWIANFKDARDHPAATPAEKVALRPTPKVAATPTPKPTPAVAHVSATPAEEEKQTLTDFFFTIPGAITVVGCAAGLLLLVTVFQKIKKSKQDAADDDEEEQGKP